MTQRLAGIDAVVRGRPEAAAEITPPIDAALADALRVAKLQRGGVLRGLVALCAAGILVFFGRWIASSIAGTLGSLTLVLALASPSKGYVALTRAIERLGELVGTVLTWALLAPIFYLFFAPFGLLARRGRGDRMGRRFDPAAKSYWISRPPKTDVERRAELERPY
jgi:hypothetical protein